MDDERRRSRRIWAAGILVAAGLAVVVWGALGEVAAVLAALALVALLVYLSVSSGGDREREEAAREEFERTGRWPDDDEA